jgi:hypothetical protein
MIRRDTNSNAVVNTDLAALNKYKMERKLHRRVESLSLEVIQIKKTLERVCEKLEKVENSTNG